jgi:hypothetical protein
MLHAAEIKFVHPVTKEEMHISLPSDMKKTVTLKMEKPEQD